MRKEKTDPKNWKMQDLTMSVQMTYLRTKLFSLVEWMLSVSIAMLRSLKRKLMDFAAKMEK